MPYLIILDLICHTINFRNINLVGRHISIWPILIYRVNSYPYKFLVLARITYFYVISIFIYFSPSKSQITIVRNERCFCSSENITYIVLAFRKLLLKYDRSLGRLFIKTDLVVILLRMFIQTVSIFFCTLTSTFNVVSSSNSNFLRTTNNFKTPRTNILSSIPPRSFLPRRTYSTKQNRSRTRSLSYI